MNLSPHDGAPLRLRAAAPADAPAVAALINTAYVVEAFFKVGDRTSTEEVLDLMRRGHFLVLESDGRLDGAVFVCRYMELHVVNLRTELPPYYRKLGYDEQGTGPFPDPETATQPCHFVVMRKRL